MLDSSFHSTGIIITSFLGILREKIRISSYNGARLQLIEVYCLSRIVTCSHNVLMSKEVLQI